MSVAPNVRGTKCPWHQMSLCAIVIKGKGQEGRSGGGDAKAAGDAQHDGQDRPKLERANTR